MYSTENINTPFSYDNVINNVFAENSEYEGENLDYDDEEPVSTLGFEC